MDRLDMCHHFFFILRTQDEAFRGRHRYPVPMNPKILDLGCGTGIWLIDMAEYVIHEPGASDLIRRDMHVRTDKCANCHVPPNSNNHRVGAPGEFIGWDLSLIQPELYEIFPCSVPLISLLVVCLRTDYCQSVPVANHKP